MELQVWRHPLDNIRHGQWANPSMQLLLALSRVELSSPTRGGPQTYREELTGLSERPCSGRITVGHRGPRQKRENAVRVYAPRINQAIYLNSAINQRHPQAGIQHKMRRI